MCLWPGYNRKVAACLAPRTCRRNLGPSAHAHQLQPAPREACPTRCDCVLHSHAIIPGGFGVLYSSSFPFSVSSTPLLCLPPARTTHQAPHHRPFSAHHQLRLRLLLPSPCIRPEILSLARLATHHAHTRTHTHTRTLACLLSSPPDPILSQGRRVFPLPGIPVKYLPPCSVQHCCSSNGLDGVI